MLTSYKHLSFVIDCGKYSLAKPLFPAMGIIPTANFIASSFSCPYCCRLPVLIFVKQTLDMTGVREQFIQEDIWICMLLLPGQFPFLFHLGK
jgi:hypothetical protein